jgi:hypothetical protein
MHRFLIVSGFPEVAMLAFDKGLILENVAVFLDQRREQSLSPGK